ncbi:phosphatase PAP2 family protein [bacterium]|nr:phosphatase PAP2 family protein [bacterium]
MKEIIQRPRPDILRLVQETDYSFPSGHTMESLAVYGLFAISLILLTKNKKIRTLIIILISIIIFLIITSRIYLGVHYFSDIL